MCGVDTITSPSAAGGNCGGGPRCLGAGPGVWGQVQVFGGGVMSGFVDLFLVLASWLMFFFVFFFVASFHPPPPPLPHPSVWAELQRRVSRGAMSRGILTMRKVQSSCGETGEVRSHLQDSKPLRSKPQRPPSASSWRGRWRGHW